MSRQQKLQKKKGRTRRSSHYEIEEEEEQFYDFSQKNGGVNANHSDDGSDDEDLDENEKALNDCLDQLSEKRSSTRILGLKTLHKLFINNVVSELVSTSEETLCEELGKCLRKGGDNEKIECCKVLQSICLNLDLSCRESFYNNFSDKLTKLASDHTLEEEVRAASVSALSMMCFLSCNDPSRIKDILDECLELADCEEPEISREALRASGILITCIPDTFVQDITHDILKNKIETLESKNTEVRIACGELLTVLVEISREEEESNFDEIYSEEIEQLVVALNEMSSDRDKSRKKTDNKKQRIVFRHLLKFVEDQEEPDESLQIGSEDIELTTIAGLLHMDALKRLLGEGVHVHLQNNPYARTMFDLPPDPPEVHSRGKGNKGKSGKANKSRDNQRRAQRDKRRV